MVNTIVHRANLSVLSLIGMSLLAPATFAQPGRGPRGGGEFRTEDWRAVVPGRTSVDQGRAGFGGAGRPDTRELETGRERPRAVAAGDSEGRRFGEAPQGIDRRMQSAAGSESDGDFRNQERTNRPANTPSTVPFRSREKTRMTMDLPPEYAELDFDFDGQLGLHEWIVDQRDELEKFGDIDTNGDALLTPRELAVYDGRINNAELVVASLSDRYQRPRITIVGAEGIQTPADEMTGDRSRGGRGRVSGGGDSGRPGLRESAAGVGRMQRPGAGRPQGMRNADGPVAVSAGGTRPARLVLQNGERPSSEGPRSTTRMGEQQPGPSLAGPRGGGNPGVARGNGMRRGGPSAGGGGRPAGRGGRGGRAGGGRRQ